MRLYINIGGEVMLEEKSGLTSRRLLLKMIGGGAVLLGLNKLTPLLLRYPGRLLSHYPALPGPMQILIGTR